LVSNRKEVNAMDYQKSCGAVVYIEKDNKIKFLLLQSKPGRYFGFPKGHVEENETERETAVREIFEETGLQVDFIKGFRESTTYKIGDLIEKNVILFLARAKNDRVKLMPDEIENFVWADYSEALGILTFENLRAILRKAMGQIKKG
jgi:bis(5'-nucleosidyl)-tetraphosphatase